MPITGGSLAAGGPITTSGLTQTTSRLLGRTTAGTGAVEEISVGTGLSLSGGTLATSGGSQLQEQLFTASGSWTAPAGVTRVNVIVIGGGGGGGSSSPCGSGGRGGAGGVATGIVTVIPGTNYTVTVGSGGNGGAVNANQNGVGGGTSSFGALMSATGGGGGIRNGAGGANGAAGTGSGGITRNTNVGVAAPSPFDGTISIDNNISPPQLLRGYRASSFLTGAISWTISLSDAAGSRGDSNVGGVGGVVYLQWVG